MSTSLMVDSFDHAFVLHPEASAQVLALIESDRRAGRLRSAEESDTTKEQALNRFCVACSALCELSPRLRADGDARRGVARSHLVELGKVLNDLGFAIHRLQGAIGNDTYDNMPPGALAALQALTGARAIDPAAERTFADFLPDPLAWQSRAAQLAVTAEWVENLQPLVARATASFENPGKSRGSAPRMAGAEILFLLRLLDRSAQGAVRRPSRSHLAQWLDLMFDITGERPPANMLVLAKNVLADQFPKDANWRHPEPPWLQVPRNILSCSIGADRIPHWSGALVDGPGQRDPQK
jgi:hypothetical protein